MYKHNRLKKIQIIVFFFFLQMKHNGIFNFEMCYNRNGPKHTGKEIDDESQLLWQQGDIMKQTKENNLFLDIKWSMIHDGWEMMV
jgi:hypothetical protein